MTNYKDIAELFVNGLEYRVVLTTDYKGSPTEIPQGFRILGNNLSN